jgi:hypothetical protein
MPALRLGIRAHAARLLPRDVTGLHSRLALRLRLEHRLGCAGLTSLSSAGGPAISAHPGAGTCCVT